ncbi:MAG TPA: sulfatase [Blastocatellia bacterium]|nr:sulfatase [Blastocatellia bacterium]
MKLHRTYLGPSLMLAILVVQWKIEFPASARTNVSQAPASKPNIVFIYVDDMGYGDLGCYGARAIKTPNIDRMAAEGLRLTSFYSVSPICTPSRAALLTGRYAARMGIDQMHLQNVLFPTDKTGLPQTETTVATALKKRGYATACVGKWHLGHLAPHRPIDHGFDYYFGIPYSNDMRPTPILRNAEVVEEPADQDTLTRRYTEEAIRFIERSKGQQFFLYLAHNMPHIPLHASPRFRGKSAGGLYGDVVEELDWSVGEVLATLKRLGLDGNTIVFFSSDNGPWYEGSPGPLRGRKGWTYDGGVREPGIVRWPGHIKPGRVSDEPVATLDFFPTALTLAGEGNPSAASSLPLDGKNVLPFLLGQVEQIPDNLYLFFDAQYLQTARMGRWKIHVARWNIPRYTAASGQQKNITLKTPELYDLTTDVGESYNLAADHPQVIRDLQGRIAAILRTFPEEIKVANAELLRPPQS